jgi:hypothetical protein
MMNTARFTGPIAVVLGAIGVVAAPIVNADSSDDAYLQSLKSVGITWASGGDQAMIQVGHEICGDFDKGLTYDQSVADTKKGSQLSDASVGKITGAAVGAYCPQYLSKLPGS